MAVHRLWRFPRGESDFESVLSESSEKAEIPGLNQLNSDELADLRDLISISHSHNDAPHRSRSMVVQRIRAPAEVVWSVVRRFDNPQAYKQFIRSCCMEGDGRVGSMREVRVVSGLPAANSTERLEILDEERYVLSFRVVGGQHRLRNYQSTTTLHGYVMDGCTCTIVIESYVVDVPDGNTKEETRVFADTIVRSNLQSLARTSELLVRNAQTVVVLE